MGEEGPEGAAATRDPAHLQTDGPWVAQGQHPRLMPQKIPACAQCVQPLQPPWFFMTSAGLTLSLPGSSQPSGERLIPSSLKPPAPCARAQQEQVRGCGAP